MRKTNPRILLDTLALIGASSIGLLLTGCGAETPADTATPVAAGRGESAQKSPEPTAATAQATWVVYTLPG